MVGKSQPVCKMRMTVGLTLRTLLDHAPTTQVRLFDMCTSNPPGEGMPVELSK